MHNSEIYWMLGRNAIFLQELLKKREVYHFSIHLIFVKHSTTRYDKVVNSYLCCLTAETDRQNKTKSESANIQMAFW